jgi:hypothetical protein
VLDCIGETVADRCMPVRIEYRAEVRMSSTIAKIAACAGRCRYPA